MDDPLLVRGLERRRDLLRDASASSTGSAPAREPCGKVFAVDEFHHERAHYRRRVFDAVDAARCADDSAPRAICASRTNRPAVGVRGKLRRQELQRDVAIEPRVAGTIDLAHASGADGSDNAIRSED